jgi:tyrosyl-tRNA synthetase
MKKIQLEKIKELLTRNVEKVVDRQHLERVLKSGKQLRVKLGIDPTGPKIHLGRAVSLWKLRAFQELGHRIVLIIGDFTAQIGDASDKKAMRRVLSEKEVKENMRDYIKQVGKILDMSKAEVHYNSEWLEKLSAKDLLNLSMKFTAQQMIQRRNFKERWSQGKPIGLHELDYPLLQGYDSVAIKADVEIGGFDQLFNLEIGRQMQKIFCQKPQDIMLLKMLPGLDSRKMSTSWGNIITLVDAPNDMYGKIMSMKDELIAKYFEFATLVPLEKVEEIKRSLKNKSLHPGDAKAWLAKEIVSLYHGKQKAEKAEEEFEKVFREKKLPSEISTFKLSQSEVNILDILVETKLVSSRSEGKRLISQKAVKINEKIQQDWQKKIKIKKGMIIQVGKRRFAKLD